MVSMELAKYRRLFISVGCVLGIVPISIFLLYSNFIIYFILLQNHVSRVHTAIKPHNLRKMSYSMQAKSRMASC